MCGLLLLLIICAACVLTREEAVDLAAGWVVLHREWVKMTLKVSPN